jgi:hypothetical protein
MTKLGIKEEGGTRSISIPINTLAWRSDPIISLPWQIAKPGPGKGRQRVFLPSRQHGDREIRFI